MFAPLPISASGPTQHTCHDTSQENEQQQKGVTQPGEQVCLFRMLEKAVVAVSTPLKNTPLCEENSCSAGSPQDFKDSLKLLPDFI